MFLKHGVSGMRKTVRNLFGAILVMCLGYLAFLAIRDRTSGEIVVHQKLFEIEPKSLQDSAALLLSSALGSIGPQMKLQSSWITFSPGERRRRFEVTMRGLRAPSIYDVVFVLIDEKGHQIFSKKLEYDNYDRNMANSAGKYTFIVAETTSDLPGKYRFVSNLRVLKAITEIDFQVRQDFQPLEMETTLLLVGIIVLCSIVLVLVRPEPRDV